MFVFNISNTVFRAIFFVFVHSRKEIRSKNIVLQPYKEELSVG